LNSKKEKRRKIKLFSIQLKNELPHLEEVVFVGNPLEEKHTAEGDWRKLVTQKLKVLKKLDGKIIQFRFKNY
jgi:hypothetical protein